MAENDPTKSSDDFEVTELDDKDLDDVSGGFLDGNCGCNGNCGCGGDDEVAVAN